MTTSHRLPCGSRARLSDPRVPFLPHYRVLHLVGDGAGGPEEEAELLALGRTLARRLAEEERGDPEAFSILFHGARTRRLERAHVHLLPADDVAGRRRALLFLSLKRALRLGRSLGARPRAALHELGLRLRSALARWRLAGAPPGPPPPPTAEIAGARARFEAAWREAGCDAPAGPTFEELARRYGEPHRHYHTLHHVLALLRGLERHEGPVVDRSALVLAIFFHDAVQVPGRDDDEEASRQLARARLGPAGIDARRLEAVEALVLATRHRGRPAPGDASLLADLDLSVLGALPGAYDAYARAVRREYAWVPERTWRRHRGRLLRSWLGRPAIFHTAEHRARLEARARVNLQRELEALDGGRPPPV